MARPIMPVSASTLISGSTSTAQIPAAGTWIPRSPRCARRSSIQKTSPVSANRFRPTPQRQRPQRSRQRQRLRPSQAAPRRRPYPRRSFRPRHRKIESFDELRLARAPRPRCLPAKEENWEKAMDGRFLAVALMAAALGACGGSEDRSEPQFSGDRIKSDVAFLADDKLEGRYTGSPGYEIAARFVAARFAALGLQPGNRGS